MYNKKPNKMKYCKFCKQDKPKSCFCKHPNTIDKLNNKCKQCVKEYRMLYNKTYKEKILGYNIEFNKTYNKEWGKNNPHIIKWRQLLYRCLIYKGKKKNTKTEDILGYSISIFKQHIESQFKGNMNWENTHIDHKIPLTWFSINTPPNVINNLLNLQPLLIEENISKLNRYSHPIDENYFLTIQKWILPQYLKHINTTNSQYSPPLS
jgi:hypothetical protein